MNITSFAGHMIDQPNRNPSRFPSDLKPQARNALINATNTIQQGFACGADILFQKIIDIINLYKKLTKSAVVKEEALQTIKQTGYSFFWKYDL